MGWRGVMYEASGGSARAPVSESPVNDTEERKPRSGADERVGGACAVIDEDLYCLACGYNLRGLSGDPVRCPECGYVNDLGTIRIPADLIRKALRNMETAPTACVGCALGACLGVLMLVAVGRDASMVGTVLLVACAAGWWAGRVMMRKQFDGQAGWKRILFDFHMTTLLCVSVVPVALAASAVPVPEQARVLLVVTVWVGAVVVGLRIYFAARARLKVMQREAAVRIAAEMLDRMLRTRR